MVTALIVVLVVALLVLALLAVGVVAAVRTGRRSAPTAPAPATRKGSPADSWLSRGERAAAGLRSQVADVGDQPVAGQLSDVDATSAALLADLRRVAGQVTSVEQSLYGIDAPRLREQRADPTGSVAEQLAIAERLTGVREGLLDRMESTVIGLEGLSARLGEVLALSATAGGVDPTRARLGEMSDQLDGLRLGLEETEQVSRQAMLGLPPASDGTPS